MNHVAIDLGSKQSQVCVRNAAGKILYEEKLRTRELKTFFVGQKEKSRVVVEACSEAFAVADMATASGHEVRVVPATLAQALGVGRHGVKNDIKDARQLSEASSMREQMPGVHIPSQRARDLKELCTHRNTVVKTRTQIINTVKGALRARLIVLKTTKQRLPKVVRETLLARPEGVPGHIERLLQMLELQNRFVKEADEELARIAKADTVCQRLMTVPGVGAMTSVRFLAVVDDIKRFPNAHCLESYLGLTPGEDSSSKRERRTGVTKAGDSMMRWLLCQAALSAMKIGRASCRERV